ncbi:MAG: endolytic transglycosylase MltG [Aromatoleum sp.]|nr:endolytic transglycosylase MltG [Aromatoleum sp.]
MPAPLRLFTRVVAAFALAFAAAAGFAGWQLQQPLALPTSPYPFDVKAGASLTAIARELTVAGVIPGERWLTLLGRWRGVDRTIKAGNYEISAGITLSGLLDKLTQGDVTQAALTVVEGSTFAEFREMLAANPAVTNTLRDVSDAELMKRIGAEGSRPEGWFFPDTYFFGAGSNDVALLTRAHRLMQSRLGAAWAKRASDLPLNDPYQALILASIVEKETGRAADRPLIASVFVNRLRIGMRLQTDPTVIYGMGAAFDGNLRKRDLEADTPYNTYTRDGLPPTPIALPGQRSLEATTNPPKTSYLYFVARGDGTSEFSATLSGHNQAVAKFQTGGR